MNSNIINGLIILLNADIRLAYCTLYKVNGIWSHNDKRCPKCVAIALIKLSTG